MSATDSSSFEFAFRPVDAKGQRSQSADDLQFDRIQEASQSGSPAPGGAQPAESFQSARTRFWLNGEVLACTCPDCASPMSIRLWLMLADCWVCGASIELTEEEERAARKLLERHSLSVELPAGSLLPPPPPAAPTPPPPAPIAPAALAPIVPAAPVARVATPPAPPQPPSAPVRRPAAQGPGLVRSRLEAMERDGPVVVVFRDTLRFSYAWLASAIIHMAILILLAFVLTSLTPERERPLTLSVRVNSLNEDGGFKDEDQLDPISFDDPGELEPHVEQIPMPPGPLGAFDEPLDIGKPIGIEASTELPGVELPGGGESPFFGRSPEARNRIALQEGGTIESEAAVTRGLEWLMRHQNQDGSWSLHAFSQAGDCNGRCRNTGCTSDTGGTALALLPFLGAGQTHRNGNYQDTVRKGLDYLVKVQARDGSLMGPGDGRMYAHGQAAIVLCEAFALTQDEKLRSAAQLALDYIVKAQHNGGGWRYYPGQAGDTSVVGWQLMALRSGQMAYLKVPDVTIDRARKYLISAQCDSSGARYAYMPGHGPSAVMTAEGLLCRQYLGWQRDHPGLQDGCRWLLSNSPPRADAPDVYYWYYATQVMHHMGGKYFEQWNSRMRDILVKSQRTKGHEAGSWDPEGGHAGTGGRLYQTALAICTLEVYYRHMPLYRTTAAEK